MNIEQLQDAINLIDDDLLEEVDKIRNQECHVTVRRNKRQWNRLVTIAACFCIFGISAYATKDFWIRGFTDMGIGTEQESDGLIMNEAMEEEADDEGDVIAGLDSSSKEDGNVAVKDQSNNLPDDTSENTSAEIPSVYVEITEWQEDGFYGIAQNEVEKGLLTEGTRVFVELDSHISIDKGKLPAGSLVFVNFMTSGEELHAEDDSSIRKILYAVEVGAVKNTERGRKNE